MRDRPLDVLIAGYFGYGNFGDEMILDASISAIKSAGVSIDRICVLSSDPKSTEDRCGVASIDRWGMRRVFSALSSSRSLIFPGGGLFQDATSVKSCFYYWMLASAACARRAKTAALGQSIGPLRRWISKKMTANAFKHFKYAAVRDKSSEDAANSLGVSVISMPDTIYGAIPIVGNNFFDRAESGSRKKILINVRPAIDDDLPIKRVAAAARCLASSGCDLLGVAMCEDDVRTFIDSRYQMPSIDIVVPKSADDLLQIARDAFAAVGMRLHFVLFLSAVGLEVAVAPYDAKVSSWASANGAIFLTDDIERDISALLDKTALTNERVSEKIDIEHLRELVERAFKEALVKLEIL